MGGPPGETARRAAEAAAAARGGRVGFLGGTFDPPHLGHVELARTALEALRLERLVVMVVGKAPHKQVATDAETRFALAAAAFEGVPHVELSRHEVDRPGPSYTVETARWVARQFDDPVWIVGADEFAEFPTWRDPEGVLEHVKLAVATRPGYERPRLDAVLSRLARPDRVEFFELRPVPISSREIRARVAAGGAVEHLVPAAVARLIDERGLYRA
jgi:nicotinate-nucleotide adenylyltransferase